MARALKRDPCQVAVIHLAWQRGKATKPESQHKSSLPCFSRIHFMNEWKFSALFKMAIFSVATDILALPSTHIEHTRNGFAALSQHHG